MGGAKIQRGGAKDFLDFLVRFLSRKNEQMLIVKFTTNNLVFRQLNRIKFLNILSVSAIIGHLIKIFPFFAE